MNFSIDARGINLYKGSGIGTYTENLVKELLILDTENKYTIFWAGENYREYKGNNSNVVVTSKKHGLFYENYYYPSFIKEHNIDLHHIPQNGIGLTDDYSIPSIVTIHDLIPYLMPETVGRGYLERFLKNMPYIISKTKGILTVSEYSKKDILRFFPSFAAENIFVTPLAANKTFKPLDKDFCTEYLSEKYRIDFPFILYIGGFSKRKNVKELIVAFNKISNSLPKDYKLVLCGSVKDEGEKLKEFCKENFIDDKVIFTGFVPDKDLPIFYNGCDLFVYPSLYEGFGLPPLEAMSCRTAVITSNLTSIPEVTKDSAILINPFNKDELQDAMYSILSSDNNLKELAEKGYKNSLNFTWRKTAELTLNAYKTLLKDNKT